MDRRARTTALLSLFFVALACGGRKSPRAPVPRPAARTIPESTTPAPLPAPPPPDVLEAPPTELLDALAPEPRIRVGLTTSADVVRLTSSRPFRIGSDAAWIEAQDVLVETVSSAPEAAGFVHRVKLASFPTESAATQFLARVAKELEGTLGTRRESGSGRYAVRFGEYGSEEGARAQLRELERLGFEGAEVVSEPGSRPRPGALSMIAPGLAPLVVPTLALSAFPREPPAFVEVDGSPYRGYVEIAVNRANALTVTNVVSLEDYLRGVVPAELSPEAFPQKEALKAQAIAARTYAVKRAGEYAAEGYDICATPACQVYRGVSVEDRLSDEAVRETAGEVLTYGGRAIDALYTSTCGGRTENAENVFSTAQPYLVSRACFLEGRTSGVVSRNGGPQALAEAVLAGLGVSTDTGSDPPSYGDARRWTGEVLDRLGQRPCWREGSHEPGSLLDVPGLARLLEEALCWESRLPFLVTPVDAERIAGPEVAASARLPLALALREGLVAPRSDGIREGRPVDRRELFETLYRVLEKRGEPPLREGRVESVDGERLVLVDAALEDDENEIVTVLAPRRSLYRSVEGAIHYIPRLDLLRGDRIRFRVGDDGIDVLVLLSDGGTFDRSSRFSHWVVRKSNEDLSREVNLHHPVGELLELRPKRYGRSGRLAELELVGRSGSTTIRGLAIRRTLGLRENLFFVDAQRGPDGLVRGWVFTGRGWGHGVGMCQVGAYGMAASGFGYRDILAHYYSGAVVQPVRGY